MSARRIDTPGAGLEFTRERAWQVAAVLLVATSLHVVPQWLSSWIDPALSMIALMVIDAAVVAAVLRSSRSWRVAAALVLVFAVVILSRQQNLVALPSVLLNVLATAAFGLSLRRGRTPLIHVIAAYAMEPDPVEPDFARYLRRLTAAWALFFGAMAVACAVLALVAPFAWWSLFANVLSWPLIGAMFCLEYLVRRVLFPHLPDHTPLQTIASTLAFPRLAAAKSAQPR
jgi:uncharacterized membrane protein